MIDYRIIEQRLFEVLGLQRRPVAVTLPGKRSRRHIQVHGNAALRVQLLAHCCRGTNLLYSPE